MFVVIPLELYEGFLSPRRELRLRFSWKELKTLLLLTYRNLRRLFSSGESGFAGSSSGISAEVPLNGSCTRQFSGRSSGKATPRHCAREHPSKQAPLAENSIYIHKRRERKSIFRTLQRVHPPPPLFVFPGFRFWL